MKYLSKNPVTHRRCIQTVVENDKSKMYKLELHQTLCKITQVFEYTGIWPDGSEPIYRQLMKKIGFQFFIFSTTVFLCANTILCDDKNGSAIFTQLTISSIVLCQKCLYLIYKKREIIEFLFDPILSHATEECIEYDQFSGKIKKFMIAIHVYLCAVVISLSFNILYSFFTEEKMLPLFIHVSWQVSEPVHWILCVSFSFSMILYNVVSLFNVLLWYIMFNYSLAYLVLGNKLAKLGYVAETKGKDLKNLERKIKRTTKVASQLEPKLSSQNAYVKDLIGLIKAHQNLSE